MKDKKTILFVCTGNSCRSQMAEGFMNFYLSTQTTQYRVLSAGLKPSGVNNNAIKVMKEKNIDISNQTSNYLEDYIYISHEYVITLCDNAKESCPTGLVSKKNIHWSIPDPYVEGETGNTDLSKYRLSRDMINSRIEKLVKIICEEE